MERRRERGREGEKETGREGVRGRRVSQIVEQLTDKERERLRARDTRSGTYAKDTTRHMRKTQPEADTQHTHKGLNVRGRTEFLSFLC
jgi:hypothetical protein